MRYLILALCLVGCATAELPTYQPANNDEYIEQLQAQSDQEIKADTLKVYTYAGIAIFMAGVATLSFTPRIRSGLFLMLGGSLAMASPFILNSEWFSWIFGVAITLALLDGLWILYKFSKQFFIK
jgi:hypothetical protein